MRIHEGLTFVYSISFFLFIQRGNKEYQVLNAIVYTLLLVAFIVLGIWSAMDYQNSLCQDTAYGKMSFFISIINLVSGLIILVSFAVLLVYFRKNR